MPRHILVVEDEYLVAQDLTYELRALGFDVVGPIGNVDAALATIDAEPAIDAALLDVNLSGEMVYPVADALTARGVPLILTTGYDDGAIPDRYAAADRCQKPVTRDALKRAVAIFELQFSPQEQLRPIN